MGNVNCCEQNENLQIQHTLGDELNKPKRKYNRNCPDDLYNSVCRQDLKMGQMISEYNEGMNSPDIKNQNIQFTINNKQKYDVCMSPTYTDEINKNYLSNSMSCTELGIFISKITIIQKIFRGYFTRKKFKSSTKLVLKMQQEKLVKKILEKFTKPNTKQAEKVVGYKFDKSINNLDNNLDSFDGINNVNNTFKNKNYINTSISNYNFNNNYNSLYNNNINIFMVNFTNSNVGENILSTVNENILYRNNLNNSNMFASMKYNITKNYKHLTDLIFHNSIIIKKDPYLSSIYIGDTNISNKKTGEGFLLYSNGTKLEGSWDDDVFQGFGRLINENGELYEGNFKKGKIEGKGIMRDLYGTLFIGNFINGVKNGEGTEENDEMNYQGMFKNDCRNGFGKIVFKNTSEEYEGEFKNDLLNGHGVYTFKSGDVYEGEFKDGKMNGKGTYKWASGEQYYGDYKMGIKDGYGVFKYLNGKVYEGQFRNGKPWGKGKITHKNKEYKVIFNNGKLIESHRIKNN